MYKESELKSELCERLRIPAVLRNVVNTLNADLYGGPCYRNRYGESVSMFDTDEPGVHQFDFMRGVAMVSDFTDSGFNGVNESGGLPSTLYYESWSGCFLDSLPEGRFVDDDGEETEDESGEWIEPVWEDYYEIDRATMLRAMFGAELSQYL